MLGLAPELWPLVPPLVLLGLLLDGIREGHIVRKGTA